MSAPAVLAESLEPLSTLNITPNLPGDTTSVQIRQVFRYHCRRASLTGRLCRHDSMFLQSLKQLVLCSGWRLLVMVMSLLAGHLAAQTPDAVAVACSATRPCEPFSSQIDGAVYVDSNFNGIRDSGEGCTSSIGCAGVTILLTGTDNQGNLVNRSTTTIQGRFSFSSLRGGRYIACESIPNGWFTFTRCRGPFDVGVGVTFDLDRVNGAFGNFRDEPIPATAALDLPAQSRCDDSDLNEDHSTARLDPEWSTIQLASSTDPRRAFREAPPVVLEGVVPPPPVEEKSKQQGHSEVSEEETQWNHYSHDKTTHVLPDIGYKHLLSSFVKRFVRTERQTMEAEWESALLPQFVWPTARDRVWIEGRWVFDCGHTGLASDEGFINVTFETEIHPPRALVTLRLNRLVVDVPTLPVTGFTRLPVTEADIFVSGTGGGADDYCNSTFRDWDHRFGILNPFIDPPAFCPHTGPFIPVNDRNYVFDIYPPGTDYVGPKEPNGAFRINVPTRDQSGTDVSLQWSVIDRSTQIPQTVCTGGNCRTVEPIVCPIDATSPPPVQTESSCPPMPLNPTRLRVILPFLGSNAIVLAKTIILGWDDVPSTPPCFSYASMPPALSADTGRVTCAPIREFEVRLHEFHIEQNGQTGTPTGDWRVYVDVGGQWRFLSFLPFDRDADGNNVCEGDALVDNGDDDCFRFDGQPWRVRAQDGVPIHVAVGGYQRDKSPLTGELGVDGDFCQLNGAGCDPNAGAVVDLALHNDQRIGTIEFDLEPSYSICGLYGLDPSCYYYTGEFGGVSGSICNISTSADRDTEITCSTEGRNRASDDGREISYRVDFRLRELLPSAHPTSTLVIGRPQGRSVNGELFIRPNTPLTLTPSGAQNGQELLGMQYRFRRVGEPLPLFPSPSPQSLHWTHTNFNQAVIPAQLFLNSSSDGRYILQFSAQKAEAAGTTIVVDTEPRHTVPLVLDSTPPIVTPPSDLTVAATDPRGTNWNSSVPLGTFLFGSTAVDALDPSPTPRWPQIPDPNGISTCTDLSIIVCRPPLKDVAGTTLFPIGTTTVTFGARDAAGNIGSATANVTVVVGQPHLTANMVAKGVDGERYFVDFVLRNTGTGTVQNTRISSETVATAVGAEKVETLGALYLASFFAAFPVDVRENLPVGNSTHRIRLFFRVPSTVTEFSIQLNGAFEDVAGMTFNFSFPLSVVLN